LLLTDLFIKLKKECLRDIERALAIKSCPALTKDKLVNRKAKCEALLNTSEKTYVNVPKLVTFYDNVKSSSKNDHCDDISSLKFVGSKHFPNISPLVQVKHNEPVGRHLVVRNWFFKLLSIFGNVRKGFVKHRTWHCAYCRTRIHFYTRTGFENNALSFLFRLSTIWLYRVSIKHYLFENILKTIYHNSNIFIKLRKMYSCNILRWNVSGSGKFLSPLRMLRSASFLQFQARAFGVSNHFGRRRWQTHWLGYM